MTGRLFIAVAALLISAATLPAQSPAPRIRTPTTLPISAIAVTGNKSLKTEAIIAVSGLKINDPGSAAAFDAARDRLLATGYFDVVSYSYRQQDLGFALTFTVGEVSHVFPLSVEALPITLNQMLELLKSKDPLFNGLLPGTKPSVDRAAAAVEEYLKPTNPDIRVRARVMAIGPDHYRIQFSPAEGLPVIADVAFEGSTVIKASELHEVMVVNGIGQVFSEADVQNLLDKFVRPLYEKQGYMRVNFTKITSAPDPKVKGLDVHVTVEDGPRFQLGNVSVRGEITDTRRILRIANLPTSGFANGDDLEQAATRIRDTLRGEGYLDVSVSTNRTINDDRKTVDATFDVTPGAVYTFGHLEVLGLGLDGEAAIRKMWGVKSGDPFPGGYPDHFVQSVKAEGLFDNLGAITQTPTINRQTHVVDVSLHFASAPTPQPGPKPQN